MDGFMNQSDVLWLKPTAIIDCDHRAVVEHARTLAAPAGNDPVAQAVALYYGVRDGIRYDPYVPFFLPEHYQASRVLEAGRGYCVSKAALLCALARACRIPARLGFATVRNHLATRQLIEMMGVNLFVYHGYVELWLHSRWVKATPAFNAELCARHRVPPLAFNGHDDSLFQPFNSDQQPFMEYVADHGVFADVPVDTIVAAWKQAYGADRVASWIELLKINPGSSLRDFYREKVVAR